MTDTQTVPVTAETAALAQWAEAGEFDPAFAGDQIVSVTAETAALAQWAEAGEFDPAFAGDQALHGSAAAATGRALLEAAGIDVSAFERAVGGRPRLDPAGHRGARSPRVNVAIPEDMDNILNAAALARGVRKSVLVREAIARYFQGAS